MPAALRIVAPIAVFLVIVLAQRGSAAPADGGGEISAEVRAAGLTFDASVAATDRAWVEAAVADARPEAQRLIAEVDGLITVRTAPDLGGAVGLLRADGDRAEVVLSTAALNGERALDRSATVLHELGHAVDHYLVPPQLMAQLDAGIPPGGHPAVEERFAETFARWALGGRISLAGDAYRVPTPASIEDWGAPLGLLAVQLD